MLGVFTAFAQVVEHEVTVLNQEGRVGDGLAAEYIGAMNDGVNDVIPTLAYMLAACAEWDVDPNGCVGSTSRTAVNELAQSVTVRNDAVYLCQVSRTDGTRQVGRSSARGPVRSV